MFSAAVVRHGASGPVAAAASGPGPLAMGKWCPRRSLRKLSTHVKSPGPCHSVALCRATVPVMIIQLEVTIIGGPGPGSSGPGSGLPQCCSES
jgi:hypothetical protein